MSLSKVFQNPSPSAKHIYKIYTDASFTTKNKSSIDVFHPSNPNLSVNGLACKCATDSNDAKMAAVKHALESLVASRGSLSEKLKQCIVYSDNTSVIERVMVPKKRKLNYDSEKACQSLIKLLKWQQVEVSLMYSRAPR